MHPVIAYVIAALLVGLGVYGILARRNAIGVLMGVELVLNGATVNFVAFAYFNPAFEIEGQVFALFVIVLAAAEIGVGLAIVLQLYRMRHSVAVDEVPLERVP